MNEEPKSVWREAEARTMSNSFGGIEFYRSEFDPRSGSIVRIIPEVRRTNEYGYHDNYGGTIRKLYRQYGAVGWDHSENGPPLRPQWEQLYGWREDPFSPVPETVDIQLTNWCDYGCPYCYQSSTVKDGHCDPQLVENVINGFSQPPYQIAYGGGEPTAHPEFTNILKKTAELGVVPNYTTAGHLLTDELIAASNRYCGGVALTYHAWKGIKPFMAAYNRLREGFVGQLNIHVIADDQVVKNLQQLRQAIEAEHGAYSMMCVNIVLLAYYPQGRGKMSGVMSKQTYHRDLPKVLEELIAVECKIAFSEALLPYFLSRPHIGVDIRFASRAEGLFSCYVDRAGQMSKSSFAEYGIQSIYKEAPQTIWNKHMHVNHEGSGPPCYSCHLADRCAAPDPHHYLACAYAPHNSK